MPDLTSPVARNVAGDFLAHAATVPQAPALAWPGGGLTYAELRDMAQAMASRVRRLGIGARQTVAVWADRSPETVALVLACLMGDRPVLLVPVDLRPHVLRELLERTGVNRLLATQPLDGATVVSPAPSAV